MQRSKSSLYKRLCDEPCKFRGVHSFIVYVSAPA